MSNKITISIPAPAGISRFYLSRRAVATTLALAVAGVMAAGSGVYAYWQTSQSEQAVLTQALAAVSEEKRQLEQLYSQQQDETHQLVQELEAKKTQISVLGRRVYDVEAVLGLVDDNQETPLEEVPLEGRIDAAAIDSAVRATMFRLIPNDSPMEYLRVSSSYGRRTNPITGQRHTHTGIDLTCKPGQPIYSPADGVVETVRPSNKGFGNFLTLRHSFGFMSSYAHLAKFKVRSGQFVSKGEQIATCGNSGNSTGPHLHYEIRFLGRALNPQYTMDWTPDNFHYLFEKENKVKWAPLVQLIDNTVRLQVSLTQSPYVDDSVNTVKADDSEPEHTSVQ